MQDNLTTEFATWLAQSGQTVTYEEIEDSFRDMLNEEQVELCGMTLYGGDTMEMIDPVMFRCGVSDYSDEMYEQVDLDAYVPIEDLEELEEEFYSSKCITCDDCDEYVIASEARTFNGNSYCYNCYEDYAGDVPDFGG